MSLAVIESNTPVEPDISLLPYYCDENGVHLSRQTIFSPSTKPYILIRARMGSRRGAVIVGQGDTTKVVDGHGKLLEAVVDQEEVRKYLGNSEIHFLNEIRITCTACGGIVGPPGVGRSGKYSYHNVVCAHCA